MNFRYSTADQAQIVWDGAQRGREAARNGRFLMAGVFMTRLEAIAETAHCKSLATVARNAAIDIDNIMNGQNR